MVGDDAVSSAGGGQRVVPRRAFTVGDAFEEERVAGGKVLVHDNRIGFNRLYVKMVCHDTVATIDGLQSVVPGSALREGDLFPRVAALRRDVLLRGDALVEDQTVRDDAVGPVGGLPHFVPFPVLTIGFAIGHERIAGVHDLVDGDWRRCDRFDH